MDDISVQELNERLKKKEEIILIDVRETHEHQEFNIGGELATLQTDLPLKILELAGHEDDEDVYKRQPIRRYNISVGIGVCLKLK